jgi:hypothetical protein
MGEMGLVRVMALIAFKLYLSTAAVIPVAIGPAMGACNPVAVNRTMTFPAQQHRLIIGDFAAIMVNIRLQVLEVMAVIAAKI